MPEPKTGTVEVVRLALRQEGADWVAYLAMSDTMEGAVVVGTIKMAFIADRPDRMKTFTTLMQACVAGIVESVTGCQVTVAECPAPGEEVH